MIDRCVLRYNNYNSCGICDNSDALIINGCGEQIPTEKDISCTRNNDMRDYLMIYIYNAYLRFFLYLLKDIVKHDLIHDLL